MTFLKSRYYFLVIAIYISFR